MRVLTRGELGVAVSLLQQGELVALPTDTVYGLAALLDDRGAVASLFAAKLRPDTVPLAVLCASTQVAISLAVRWPVAAERLAAQFWPGPLTVVVDAPPETSARLGAASGVGIRVPNDADCLDVLRRTGPLAVTSANLHGQAPATSALEVVQQLGDAGVAAVLDGGTRDGQVSSVVDVRGGAPTVLREGAVSGADVTSAVTGA